jgi:glycosyltransferase involved in cell wall biosynthesis
MRALTLAANAAPGVGGQGSNLSQMVRGLRDAFALRVICRAPGTDLPGGTVAEPWLPSLALRVPVLRRRRDWLTNAGDAHFDRAVAARLAPAALFQGVTGQCLASLRAAKRLGARTVLDSVTEHVAQLGAVMDAACARFGVLPPLGRAWRSRAEAEYREADLIRVMSERARLSFLDRGFDPQRVIVVSPHLDGLAPTTAAPPDVFRVSFVGLLEPWKGFDDLVAAFALLSRPDARLALWGGPGSRPVSRYLREAMARDPRIELRPVNVGRAGFAAVYGTTSVLVHPALSDGFGLVVAEAMLCGVPVIVSTAAGAADLVTEGVEGFLVPPGDRAAIAERVAYLMDNPARLAAMGAAARRRAATLTVEAFRARYVPLLESLAA